jgi:predicted ArsR family transcriptional regulator
MPGTDRSPAAGSGAANGIAPDNGAHPSALRHAILLHLRQSGPCAPDQVAAALGASRTGVTAQLHALETAGLVTHIAVRHGVGRPRHQYDLTSDAQALFPTNYDGLAVGLLAALEQLGGTALVEEVFKARQCQLAESMTSRIAERTTEGANLAERVRALASIQDEAGYLAEIVEGSDGALRLREHNCAIHDVAKAVPAACQSELELFRSVLGATVERETHIACGDRSCTYRIAEA